MSALVAVWPALSAQLGESRAHRPPVGGAPALALQYANTEPLVRLNVEWRGDLPLMKEPTEEILAVLGRFT